MARVAAGAFGFLTFIQTLEGPERYGASSFFEKPILQTARNNFDAIAFSHSKLVCPVNCVERLGCEDLIQRQGRTVAAPLWRGRRPWKLLFIKIRSQTPQH